jgi:signal transduction histidine kinase
MDNAVPFLDRTDEIAVLDRGWKEASSNRGVLSFTAGGAGLGKSTLLRFWVGQLRPLVHVSIEFSGNLGAATSTVIEAFQEVISQLSRDMGSWKEPLMVLLGRDGSGISEVFPRNPWSGWFQPTAALLDKQQLDRRFLLLLKALLRVWSDFYGPVLMTVDDWHLADGALQQLLLQLWQPGVALCCVATSRLTVEKLPLVSPLRGQSEGSPEQPVTWILQRLELKPFSESEVRAWIDSVFSSESIPRREFYTSLFAHAQGNPLYLQEIRRLIMQEKIPEKALGPLDSWFQREIEDLDPVLRGFLEAGAILGRTFSPDEAMHCADLSGEIDGLVAAAIEKRLVEVRAGSCCWMHDLVREAILHLIDPARHSILCGRAATGILTRPSLDSEQILRFPAFFQIGGDGLQLSERERQRVAGLLWDSARLSRSSMDHDSARGALAVLRDQLEATPEGVSDEIWLFSAEVAFESGAIEETIQLLMRIRATGSAAMKLRRELILCRCFYVARDFTGIFSRITHFSGVLWPARLLALLGPSLIGFLSSFVMPLLLPRLEKLSPMRISRRRELTEHLHIALVIFLFQHSHALSSALGLIFAVLSSVRSSSHNLPVACVIIGMFGNLPRFAKRESQRLARFARDVQIVRGNPFWNDRVEFIFNLLYVPHIADVQRAFAALKRMIAPGNRIRDPEVESLIKLTLIPDYFWSNAGIETLHRELLHHAQDALESRNAGLAAIFETFCGLLMRIIRADERPYRLREDMTEEDFLFHALRERNELVVASGLRFEQAFFAILAGEWTRARKYVQKAAEFPRDVSYWMSRVSDGYIECLSYLLADESGSIASSYRILRHAVRQNVREFGPYLTHIDAELARSKGRSDLALGLYRRASDSFRRLERPILAALVDWRTGDLLWDSSQKDIADAYLDRSMRQFHHSGMNSSVRAIQSNYGLNAPGPIRAKDDDEEFMTVSLRLHRLTLVGRLASEIAHEIKNVNHTLRLSAAVLETDLVSAAAESGHEESMTGVMPAVRAIQDAAGKIDQYLGQFRLTGEEPAAPEMAAVDLGEVIHTSIEAMTPVIRRFTRRFENSLAPGKCFISGQPAKIDQLVMNLVLNACESLSRLDQPIMLEAAADPARQLVGFRVRDQGCGIPAEFLPRVMEPFFTTKREKGGTGLGLALCRRIVDEHHGEMDIESQQGVGTRVTILFPSRGAA